MTDQTRSREEAIDRAIDSLHWLLHAPSLVSNEAVHPYAQVTLSAAAQTPWFSDLLNASSLRAAFVESIEPLLQQPSEHQRLGKFAERLIDFFLRNAPSELQLKHLATGVQRIERMGSTNRTVGELDFLLEHQNALVHWEMATKFYLLDPRVQSVNAPNSIHAFIGPNRSDNLARKLVTLVERQLPQQPPTPWAAVDWRSEVLLKGWLFYPFGEPLPAISQSSVLNEAHLRGWWIEHRDVRDLPTGDYIALPRLRWLARARLSSNDQPLTPQDLAAAEPQHPALYARMDSQRLEIDRYFVVPQSWVDGI